MAELVEAKKKATKKRGAKEVPSSDDPGEPADETENDAAQDGDGLPLEG
jgi:hypothetical protein